MLRYKENCGVREYLRLTVHRKADILIAIYVCHEIGTVSSDYTYIISYIYYFKALNHAVFSQHLYPSARLTAPHTCPDIETIR